MAIDIQANELAEDYSGWQNIQAAFLPLKAGAVVMQMGEQVVENLKSIDNASAIYTI
jgi:hypothetical protein